MDLLRSSKQASARRAKPGTQLFRHWCSAGAALKERGLNGPYLLVGHSLGGLYVEAFAREHPHEVSGMVLIDGTSPIEPLGVFVSKTAA